MWQKIYTSILTLYCVVFAIRNIFFYTKGSKVLFLRPKRRVVALSKHVT